ncbi:nucleoside-diphosphate kinase [Liquorilactobacillus satsumensis]|uniref:Nucleoside diphosphate kinase n=1 Tax=Liquorilactobacillus satsumensis DSM 16230 = JCM 12392 TaxID=1423801 RepID=A0A0R1V137_9LACO|nr:nucleoside-diphosphate kinase [Liquorilactobacillus satsumensis]KRL98804.1 nucleoside diphosphate kinase [Liquorilactobacillus satsumensis DSM 16230 = JCM 12392]MCC7666365.1 nucleoside-diphosphate kinase [Liquorilactobacillus satsumensis]MCP9312717.1 nucleoside-diphosphate kinase [Liquorilactobacillus satsumensis]MCP9328017.1 nucleoside-diphosphate kinase [Liquorilactobacillus satsumensis]MCP9358331.1 nucleoside-diphosphate kinase [Liquorilactobacillus satsumensis]
MEKERTLILIKPDGVAQRHIGEILTRIERKGYQIIALKVTTATQEKLRAHYAQKVDKPYFKDICAYMMEGPLVAVVAEGINIIAAFHRMAGATEPLAAAPGTIRADFGCEWADGNLRNVVHSSDEAQSAAQEIKIWFPELTEK